MQVSTLAMGVSVSRIDFKTDQIYKFEEKWISFSISLLIDLLQVYTSDDCKLIASTF